MNSRQLVFKRSLNSFFGWFTAQQFRFCLLLVIWVLFPASDLVAQRPVLIPSSESSLPVIGQPLEPAAVVVPEQVIGQPSSAHPNRPNLVSGTVLSEGAVGGALVSQPTGDDPEHVASLPDVEASQMREDINSIRRQLGGGLSQLFGGTNNRGDQLRNAARTLDQLASQFETSGLYEEADQVRAQAKTFWLKSRQFNSVQSKESLEASFQNELNRLAGNSKRQPQQPDHSTRQADVLQRDVEPAVQPNQPAGLNPNGWVQPSGQASPLQRN